MIPASFAYLRPKNSAEALAALAEPDARIIAGGHSLLPLMRARRVRPAILVDIADLDLGGVSLEHGAVRLGALLTYDELIRSADAFGLPAAVSEAAAEVGDVQVRNAGTVGGSVAHADPRSDLWAARLATEAQVRLLSPDGVRELPIAALSAGAFSSTLAPQELVSAVLVPCEQAGEGSAYVSLDDPASGYPLAGAAVRVRVAADGACACAIALTAAAAAPIRLAELEASLDGSVEPDPRVLGSTLAELVPDDHLRALAGAVIARALAAATARARNRRVD